MVEIFHNDIDDIQPLQEEVETRKIGVINTDLLNINTIGGETPLDGPCISLFLPNRSEPITLWNIATAILGCADESNKNKPIIDLSNHHAKLLGVSRIHAEIFYRDGYYFVRDLESTNGTWVNNHKLEPYHEAQLLNGDTLRLAHLMIQIGGY